MPFKTEPEKIYINSNKSSLKKKYCVASEITNMFSLKGHDNLKTFVMDKLIFLLVVFI
jgi:hypothetical protein